MKRRPSGKFLRASVGASAGALATLALGMPASAAGTSVAELTEPASTVEAGVGGVSRSSFKFGEYSGLQDRGPFAIGNLDLRGGTVTIGDRMWAVARGDMFVVPSWVPFSAKAEATFSRVDRPRMRPGSRSGASAR